jgi:uncharacterized protein (TIGR03083 family)
MDRIAIIDAESQRFSDVLSSAEPTTHCPTCPDWTAADLLWHLTEVHYFWAGVLEKRVRSEADLASVEAAKPARPTTIADLVKLRADATAALLRELTAREDAEPCWSWWPPDQTVGFTRRMQTYEATMHRYRADGVVELVATDTEARWLVEVGAWTAPSGKSAPRAARAQVGDPSTVVTGSMQDLALWAWTRGGAVGIFGEPASRDALDALITQGMV